MSTATAQRYRRRPTDVQAVQLTWANWDTVVGFLGEALAAHNPTGARTISAEQAADTCGELGPEYIALNVRTVNGEVVTVRHGDWIIADREPGTFYPCAPEVFAEAYEPEPGPQAAEIEIIERFRYDRPLEPDLQIVVPNEVRVNGQPLLTPADMPIRVHEVEVPGRDAVVVTMTVFARRVVIGAEPSVKARDS